ncbi:hypothetical protein RRG08_046098 [Elysia crispata]|uniref:Uncharacterized protein n=1 Tax=Elysia crispata TaxID=231223 RepID=A0AAE0Y5F3_9GAST|nr:hypothetical protein RRG08_046098 [Elysia crispata]
MTSMSVASINAELCFLYDVVDTLEGQGIDLVKLKDQYSKSKPQTTSLKFEIKACLQAPWPWQNGFLDQNPRVLCERVAILGPL